MKYKKLTKEQIIISLDRLTRFKNTKEKYLRVYSDILLTNLIEPKLKKNDIEKIDFTLVTQYVSEIINGSLNDIECDININNYIRDYENSVFINDEETQKLLNNKINYLGAIELIPEDCPVNLKWLKELAVMLNSFQHLTNSELKFQVIKIPKQVRNVKKLKYPLE